MFDFWPFSKARVCRSTIVSTTQGIRSKTHRLIPSLLTHNFPSVTRTLSYTINIHHKELGSFGFSCCHLRNECTININNILFLFFFFRHGDPWVFERSNAIRFFLKGHGIWSEYINLMEWMFERRGPSTDWRERGSRLWCEGQTADLLKRHQILIAMSEFSL